MINKAKFNLIKERHGHYASWAIWAAEGNRPKDNIADLSVFDLNENATLLSQLKPDTVLVGLNISRPIQFPFGNFHDGRRASMDYKIRYALKGTRLWGAYMTDVIKDFEQKASGETMAYLKKDKAFERTNLALFESELNDLGMDNPTLVAFGRDAFRVLARNLGKRYEILRVPHYSNYLSKETYREQIAGILQSPYSVKNNREGQTKLSGREQEVMELLASGKTTPQIGKRLDLSLKTIQAYLARVKEKWGLHSMAQLIRVAALSYGPENADSLRELANCIEKIEVRFFDRSGKLITSREYTTDSSNGRRSGRRG